MRPTHLLILLSAVLFTSACAHLDVAVDIASPSVVEEHLANDLLREALPEARRQVKNPGEIQTLVGAATELLLRHYVEKGVSTAQRDVTAKTASTATQQRRREQLEAEFKREVAPRYVVLAQSWTTTNDEIEQAYGRWSQCDRCWARWRNSATGSGLRRIVPPSAAGEVNRKSDASSMGIEDCKKFQPRPDCGALENTKEYLVALLKRRETFVQQLQDALQAVSVEPKAVQRVDALKSLIGEDGLFRSAEAHAIAAAKPSDWVRKFDESHARSVMGDVNVALKMETRGSFTVKGLSFDPSEIARVASRVMTQTLIAVTQPASLVAKPVGQQRATEQTGIDETVALDERKRVRQEALLAIAGRILAEEGALDNADTAKDAVKAISRTWEAQKELVLLDPAKTSSAEVLAILPDKLIVAPGEAAHLLVALAAEAGPDARVLLKSADVDIASVDLKPLTVEAGQRTKQITVTGGTKLGSSKISAVTPEGDTASGTVCVAPLLTIMPVSPSSEVNNIGPSETDFYVRLKGHSDIAFDDDAQVKVSLSHEGSGVRLDRSTLDFSGANRTGTLKMTPLDAGPVTLTASVVTDCGTRTSSEQFVITPASVAWTQTRNQLSVSEEFEYKLHVATAPPQDLKLTVTSSDPSVLTVTEGAESVMKAAGTHTVKVRAAKEGRATLVVSSDRSLFKAPADVTVDVMTPPDPTPQEDESR